MAGSGQTKEWAWLARRGDLRKVRTSRPRTACSPRHADRLIRPGTCAVGAGLSDEVDKGHLPEIGNPVLAAQLARGAKEDAGGVGSTALPRRKGAAGTAAREALEPSSCVVQTRKRYVSCQQMQTSLGELDRARQQTRRAARVPLSRRTKHLLRPICVYYAIVRTANDTQPSYTVDAMETGRISLRKWTTQFLPQYCTVVKSSIHKYIIRLEISALRPFYASCYSRSGVVSRCPAPDFRPERGRPAECSGPAAGGRVGR